MTIHDYYRGERVQNAVKGVFGVVLLPIVVWAWNDAEKQTFLDGVLRPLMALGVVLILRGSAGVRLCTNRLSEQPDPERELARLRQIEPWWVPRSMIWAALALVGLALAYGSALARWEGTGVGLVIFAFVGFIFDGFSSGRCSALSASLQSAHE